MAPLASFVVVVVVVVHHVPFHSVRDSVARSP